MASIAVGLIQSITLGGQAVSLLSLVGSDVILNSLVNSSNAVMNTVMNIMIYDSVDILHYTNKIQQLDLQYTVTIINELIVNYNKTEMTNVIKKALIGLTEILDLIHDQLLKVKESIDNHQKKWFNSYRNFECKCSLITLENYSKTLDRRFNIFVEMLKINKL